MKQQTTDSNTTAVSGFQFETEAVTSTPDSRKLAYTGILIQTSTARSIELIREQSINKPELTGLVQKVLADLDAGDLNQLLVEYFGDKIQSDAEVLNGCDADQLAKMLESRRSERSVAKRERPSSNASVCSKYIAAMYAELMIRVKTGKQFQGSNSESSEKLDGADQDALARKVKSLQSKKCRLAKLAKYDASAKKDLSEVNAEIDRLNSLRTNHTGTTSTTVKNLQIDELRTILAAIDPASLPEDERTKYELLMAKIG